MVERIKNGLKMKKQASKRRGTARRESERRKRRIEEKNWRHIRGGKEEFLE